MRILKTIILSNLFALFISNVVYGQEITRIESVQSLYLETFKDTTYLGSATGFVIKSKTQNYLITNWHVVTNKSPITKNWLDTTKQVSPNRIAIVHNAKALGNYSPRFENLTDSKGDITYREFTLGNEMIDCNCTPLEGHLGRYYILPCKLYKRG